MNLRILLPFVTLSMLAQAQQFRLLVTQGANTALIQNGSTLTFNGPIGSTTTAQLSVTYVGTGSATFSRQPNVFGSTSFAATIQSALPLTLSPGSSFTVDLRYRPASSALSSSQFSLDFSESTTTTVNGTTTTASVAGIVSLSLQGTAPSFALSYILQTDQNVTPLAANGVLGFGPTSVNTTAQAAFNISNVGSGTGNVTGISISGDAFKLSRLPLFPSAVAAAQSMQVLVLYTPTGANADEGRMTVTFDSGPAVVINITGNGVSPVFLYEVLRPDEIRPVTPGGTVELPGIAVGQTSSVIIQITNTGTASGTISSINLAGTGFQLTGTPLLPQILAPKSSLTFSIAFTPIRTGALTGNLIVNSDRFSLTGVGLGSQLTFSYTAGGTTITLDNTTTAVVFSPVTVTKSATIVVTVRNTGTLTAPISNIGIGQTDGVFTLDSIPALPMSLAPNTEIPLSITFTPAALGFVNGALRLDGTSVTLIGSGTQPPPLPTYTLTGPSGTVTPGSFNNLALTLASPYPVAIAGTLTITVSGTLPVDPAAQFSTGGQTVRFVIPANSTSAVFAGQGTQIGLQTGTVASSLALTPAFATQSGNVDLTPASPSTLRLTVAPAKPTLLALQIVNQTATGFSLAVTGFATTRTLTSMNVEFTPAAGFNLAATQFTIDLSQVATVWFRSTASQAFGGQFTLTVPFTFQGTVATGQSIASSISAVSVKVSNELGESSSLQAKN